ncbi:MAG: hypothetical protein RBU30_16390 [Polyangia bacterium]|nr:hypothetical protein [Polyangia bacterium]
MKRLCWHRGNLLVLSALLAVSASSGCELLNKQKKQKNALEFNEKIVSFNKRIHEKAFTLGDKIGKRLRSEGNITNAQLEESLAAVKAELKAIRKEAEALKVPDHDTARDLHKQYMKFLDGQDALGEKLTTAVEIVTKPTKQPGPEQMQQMQAVIQDIEATEKKSLNELQTVQRRFASAHGIELKF